MNKCLIFIWLFCFGCSLAPNYEKPGFNIDRYLIPYSKSQKKTFKKIVWSNLFKQNFLKQAIESALFHNVDLRTSELNVKEIESIYDIQYSRLLPSIDLGAQSQRRYIPQNFINAGAFGPTGAQAEDGFIQNQESLNIGIASYELDFFGKLRSLKDSARMKYLASLEAYQSRRLITIHKVVLSYFNLLGFIERERVLKSVIASYQKRIKLFKKIQKAGVISRLAMDRERLAINNLKAQIKDIQISKYKQLNNLNNTTKNNYKMSEVTGDLEDIIENISAFSANLSSSVLLRRPDIIAAELELKAANANIGAARAAFFPSVSLTTNYGYLSGDIDTLIDKNSRAWTFTPSINIPIFNWGRLSSNLEIAKIRKQKEILLYEKSILNAYRDASNSAIAYEKTKEKLDIQRKILKQSKSYYDLSQKRFDAGVTNFLSELDAQRIYLNAQSEAVDAKVSYLLYKANFLKDIAAY